MTKYILLYLLPIIAMANPAPLPMRDFMQQAGYRIQDLPGHIADAGKNWEAVVISQTELPSVDGARQCPKNTDVDPLLFFKLYKVKYRILSRLGTQPEVDLDEITYCGGTEEVYFVEGAHNKLYMVKRAIDYKHIPQLKRHLHMQDVFWEINLVDGITVRRPISEWPQNLIRSPTPQFKNCDVNDLCEYPPLPAFSAKDGVAVMVTTKPSTFLLETSDGVKAELSHQNTTGLVAINSIEIRKKQIFLKLDDLPRGRYSSASSDTWARGHFYVVDRIAGQARKLETDDQFSDYGTDSQFVELSDSRFALNFYYRSSDGYRGSAQALIFGLDPSIKRQIIPDAWVMGSGMDRDTVVVARGEKIREDIRDLILHPLKQPLKFEWVNLLTNQSTCKFATGPSAQFAYYPHSHIFAQWFPNGSGMLSQCTANGLRQVAQITGGKNWSPGSPMRPIESNNIIGWVSGLNMYVYSTTLGISGEGPMFLDEHLSDLKRIWFGSGGTLPWVAEEIP